jgi:hypothetical protein
MGVGTVKVECFKHGSGQKARCPVHINVASLDFGTLIRGLYPGMMYCLRHKLLGHNLFRKAISCGSLGEEECSYEDYRMPNGSN